jgi:spoIIIJ-associated protein
MKQVEISAPTVEEATQQALKELGVSREQIEIDVLSEGKSGVLGIGREEARIRASLVEKNPAGHQIDIVTEVLGGLLRQLELTADIQAETGAVADEEGLASPPVVYNISGDDLGILIGRRGQTLTALQYLVRLMTSQKMGSAAPLVLDVNSYKKRRYESLRILAEHVAEQVTVNQRSFALEPMPAYERRIIHLALSEHPQVTTLSVGFGDARKVTVMPKNQTNNRRSK